MIVYNERQEAITRENKIQLDRLLEEAEAMGEQLRLYDERKAAAVALQEAQEREEMRQQRLAEAKALAQQEKENERRIILLTQKESRSKRIAQQMKYLKALFRIDFEEIAVEIIERAKNQTTAYIENPENKLAINLKFEALKREFYANPTPETREREKMLSSLKNILFLFVDAKLKADNLEIADLLPLYDKRGKGYLSYGEFAELIRSLETSLNEAQISTVTRAVDKDNYGFIDMQELLGAMKRVDNMGVPGSDWKLYIDSVQDVICYHNFVTHEKILESEMKDKTLRQIVIANIYGEASYHAKQQLKAMRQEKWKERLQNYMAKRLQTMYRVWKGRQYRKKMLWRLRKRENKALVVKQRKLVDVIVKTFYGRQSHQQFRRQLKLTYEKIYAVTDHHLQSNGDHRYFYFNHQIQESTWDMPSMLRRYGDVTMPCVWVPLDPSPVDHHAIVTSAYPNMQASKGSGSRSQSKMVYLSTDDRSTDISSTKEKTGKEPQSSRQPLLLLDAQSQEQEGSAEDNMIATGAAGEGEQQLVVSGDDNNTTLTIATELVPTKIRYYHVKAKRAFPGKPDGFPLCQYCFYQLAVHTCLTSGEVPYCFGCHRLTHANPFGFHQRAKARRIEYSNPDFVSKLYNFQHEWKDTLPSKCGKCSNKKINAAFHCEECQTNLCRNCFKRLHEHEMKPPHRYYLE